MNCVDQIRNLVMAEIFVNQLESYCLLEDKTHWRILNSSASHLGKKLALSLLYSHTEDFELEVKQVKLSSICNHLIANLPQSLPVYPKFNPVEKGQDDLESSALSTFTDLSVILANISITHNRQQTVLLRADSFQVIKIQVND